MQFVSSASFHWRKKKLINETKVCSQYYWDRLEQQRKGQHPKSEDIARYSSC